MVSTPLSEVELRRELDDVKERYPNLGDDELFVLWFLRAFVAEDEATAAKALCGGPCDKGFDAVLIDEPARIVFVVQGKYREKVARKREHRGDVAGFAQLAVGLCGDEDGFESLVKDLSPEVAPRLEEARVRLKKRNYALHHYYATLGRCSRVLLDEANRIVRSADAPTTFELFDGNRVLLLLSDYLDGVAPPVPSLDLEIESGGGVRTSGVFNRYDSKTEIESWAFSMTDAAIASLYERAGTRLFARNVRGFLGSTEINRGMEATLQNEAEYFWYYNNGVTIICDEAKQERSRGRDILRVTNPQIINGQQTTRTLARSCTRSSGASVLVRVISVPRLGQRGAPRLRRTRLSHRVCDKLAERDPPVGPDVERPTPDRYRASVPEAPLPLPAQTHDEERSARRSGRSAPATDQEGGSCTGGWRMRPQFLHRARRQGGSIREALVPAGLSKHRSELLPAALLAHAKGELCCPRVSRTCVCQVARAPFRVAKPSAIVPEALTRYGVSRSLRARHARNSCALAARTR